MEKGTVIEIKGNKMTMRLEANEACKRCGGCAIIDGQAILSDVENTVEAQKGDRVLIENKAQSVVIAALVIYIVPLIFLVAGYFLGLLLTNYLRIDSNWAIFMGLISLTIGFFLVKIIDRRIGSNQNFKPYVLRKL